MNKNKRLITTSILALVIGSPAIADVRLPSIINNQMILQNGKNAPIWGWADAGEVVTVSFAGQTKKATATTSGKWLIKLDPLAVSAESRTMTITGNNEIKLDDVLVGEVWLASGQSNMEYSIGGIPEKEKQVASKEKNNTLLRMFCLAPKISSSLPLDDAAGYWSDCSYFIQQMEGGKIKNYDSHSAVGFFFGLKLQQELKIPIAVIDSSWGGTKIESWISDDGYEMEGLALQKLPQKDEATAITDKETLAANIAAWRAQATQSIANGGFVSAQLKAPRSRVPNAIYNGMIAPLAPYSIKGVVWYQGESNRGQTNYLSKLKALSGGWSKAFNTPDIPFYLVQLAPFNYAKGKNKDTSPQMIYDTVVKDQYQAAKEIKGCDVITIPDTVFGKITDIHPAHKKTAGDRLAALALKHDYGQSVIYSGPRFTSAKAKGESVIVSFEHIDKGLETSDGEAPNWFEIAGADKNFVTATAQIVGDTVVVSSPEVTKPKYIRLAWNNIAELNLRDQNGWPAFSFNAEVSP